MDETKIKEPKPMNTDPNKIKTTEQQHPETTYDQPSQYDPTDLSLNGMINRSLLYFDDDLLHQLIPTPTSHDHAVALRTGYIVAFHKVRTYNYILTDSMQTPKQQIYLQLKNNQDILDVFYAYDRFINIDNRDDFNSTGIPLQETFIYGYRAALHIAGKYDPALFLQGHQLSNCILAGIISLRNRYDTALRAEARLAQKHFNSKPKQKDGSRRATTNDASCAPDYTDRFTSGETDTPVDRVLYVAPEIAAAVEQDMALRAAKSSEGKIVHEDSSPCHIDTATDT